MNRFIHIIALTLLFVLVIIGLHSKSIPKAMAMSAIIPGTGEIYNGNISRGVMFITFDAILAFGNYRFAQETDALDKSFKQFAYSKANIPLGSSSDFYKLIHRYYSSDHYNAEVELYFRNLGLIRYNDPNYYNEQIQIYTISDEDGFHWKSDKDWTEYKYIRRDKQSMIINRKLAIGSMIANRLISVIDAAFLVKKTNKINTFKFSLTPNYVKDGAMLNCSMEF